MSEAFSYDLVPYPGMTFKQSHPNRLATVATLFGLNPPPLDRCRVLELGCGRGDNIIPLAMQMQAASFVGIDLARSHVEMAQASIAAMGVVNVRIEQGNILDLPRSLGSFDYVIAHGVYSWVPPRVREALLAACCRHLAPEGIAYVSYNTLPGWRLRGVVRDALLFHVRDIADPAQRIARSSEFLEFMCDAVPPALAAYRSIFQGSLMRMESEAARASLMYHDFLEADNEPVYFAEFAARAERHGLRYVGEAHYPDMRVDILGPVAAAGLARYAGNVVEREQYMDFIKSRIFRQSLLCHADRSPLADAIPGRVRRMMISADLTIDPDTVDLRSRAPMRLKDDNGVETAADEPLTKAALLCLVERFPLDLGFDELTAAAWERLSTGELTLQPGAEHEAELRALCNDLLNLYGLGSVELQLHPPSCCLEPGERPLASRWARHRLGQGEPICNLRFNGIRLEDLRRRVLLLLDGNRDQGQLLDALCEQVRTDDLVVCDNERRLTDDTDVRLVLAERLPQLIAWLARAALLEA